MKGDVINWYGEDLEGSGINFMGNKDFVEVMISFRCLFGSWVKILYG